LHPEPIYLLKRAWCSINKSLANGILLDWMYDIMPELMVRKILIDDSTTDQQELKTARERALQALDRPTILYLMMAQSCNFTCSYCPIPALAKQYGERLLSLEDAIAGIELWQKHIEEYPQNGNPYFLIFYGGEPLLNRGILEQLLPHIAREQSAGRLPENLKLMLCTNGSLIDEGLSRIFASYRVTVALGGDGPHIIIQRVVKQLLKNSVSAVASVIITPENIHRLSEYPGFLQRMGITKFGFNLMKGKALGHALSSGISIEDYCHMAAQGILAGLSEVIQKGQCYEYQLEKKLTALQNGLPFSVDCTCYGNQLVIQPDGQVTNCPFLRLDQGHVRELANTFRIGRTDTVKKWRRRLPIFNDLIMADSSNEVLDGGGCAWSSSELYGDTTIRDTANTIFTKEVIHELIWTLLPEKQANLLRRKETSYWNYRRIRPL